MKHKKTIIKFLGMLLLGGCFGFAISFILDGINVQLLKDSLTSIHDFMLHHSVWFQAGTLIAFMGPAAVLCKGGITIMKSQDYIEDEGELEKKADGKLNLGLLLSQLYFIASIVVFAVATNSDNDYLMVCAGIFLVGIFLYAFIQVWVVNVIKSQDDLKEGDPSSFSFQRQWLDSLDEAEKYRTYKAAYKTFAVSNMVMMITLMGTFLSKILLDTSMATVVLIACLWAIQTITFTVYASKTE